MSWIFFALAGYFLSAVAMVLDKFLLSSDRLPRPGGYTFLVSLFSLFTLVFAPFGLQFETRLIVFGLVSGLVFTYGIYFLFVTIKQNTVSRAAPLVGIFQAGIAFLPALAGQIFQDADHTILTLLAIMLLVAGTFLIAFDLPIRHKLVEHLRYPLLAGMLLAVANMILKYGYVSEDLGFVSGVVWSRVGFFLGGLSLFLIPKLRREIHDTWREMLEPKRRRRNAGTGVIFVANKTLAGLSGILVAKAIHIGSAGFSQALIGTQFLFVLVLAVGLSKWYPRIFEERLLFWDWFQKGVAVVLLIVGLWLTTAVAAGQDFLVF